MYSALSFINPTSRGPFSILLEAGQTLVINILPDEFACWEDAADLSGPIFQPVVESLINPPKNGIGVPPSDDTSPTAETVGIELIKSKDLEQLFADCQSALECNGQIAVVAENPSFNFLSGLRQRLRGKSLPKRSPGQDGGKMPPLPNTVVRTLKRVGYSGVSTYWISPSLNQPWELQPLSRPTPALRDFVNSFTAPAYLVVATENPGAGLTLLEQVMSNLIEECAVEGRNNWSIERIMSSAKEKFIVAAKVEDQCLILRLPRTAAAERAERKAHGFLKAFATDTDIAKQVPQPVMEGIVEDQPVFAERQVAGRALREVLEQDNRAHYVSEVDTFLRALNPSLLSTERRQFDGDLMERVVAPMLDLVLSNLTDTELRQRARQAVIDSLRGASSRIGMIHGDFSVSNIFVKNRKISGVIDWENGLVQAPPVLDALNYLDSVQRSSSRFMSLLDTIPMLAGGRWPVKEEFGFLKEFFQFCDIDFRYRQGFALLYFLYHVGPQLSFADPEKTAEKRVGDVIRQFLDNPP